MSASFVRVGQSGLGHALLLPAKVETKTGEGVQVNITCTTNYPFGDTLEYSITASGPFDFYVRVPDWYDPSASTIAINGNFAAIAPDMQSGMTKLSISEGVTTVNYVLKTPSIHVVARANSSVAIYHGAILYALDVGQSATALAPDSFIPINYVHEDFAPYTNQMPTDLPPIPAQAHDYSFTCTRPWNIAIDVSTVVFHSGPDNDTAVASLPNPLWIPGGPPTYITARGCQIDWPIISGVPAPVPLPVNGKRNCTSPAMNITLRPYGSLKIHMAELPTVDLALNETIKSF